MLVCDGRVTTLWAWASVKTVPVAARRSRVGVLTIGFPVKPRASARRVSRVTSRTSGRAGGLGPGSFVRGRAPLARSARARNASIPRQREGERSGRREGPSPADASWIRAHSLARAGSPGISDAPYEQSLAVAGSPSTRMLRIAAATAAGEFGLLASKVSSTRPASSGCSEATRRAARRE